LAAADTPYLGLGSEHQTGTLVLSGLLLHREGVAIGILSLLRNMFADPRQRTLAIGVWISSFSAGAAIGPLAGGVLLERFWWGSVFLLAVPVMALLLVLGPVLLPEYRDPADGRLDLASTAMLAAGLAGAWQRGAAPRPDGCQKCSKRSILAIVDGARSSGGGCRSQ
jgi:MFS family permease